MLGKEPGKELHFMLWSENLVCRIQLSVTKRTNNLGKQVAIMISSSGSEAEEEEKDKEDELNLYTSDNSPPNYRNHQRPLVPVVLNTPSNPNPRFPDKLLEMALCSRKPQRSGDVQ